MKQLSLYLLVHHLGFVFVFYIEKKIKRKKKKSYQSPSKTYSDLV